MGMQPLEGLNCPHASVDYTEWGLTDAGKDTESEILLNHRRSISHCHSYSNSYRIAITFAWRDIANLGVQYFDDHVTKPSCKTSTPSFKCKPFSVYVSIFSLDLVNSKVIPPCTATVPRRLQPLMSTYSCRRSRRIPALQSGLITAIPCRPWHFQTLFASMS